MVAAASNDGTHTGQNSFTVVAGRGELFTLVDWVRFRGSGNGDAVPGIRSKVTSVAGWQSCRAAGIMALIEVALQTGSRMASPGDGIARCQTSPHRDHRSIA